MKSKIVLSIKEDGRFKCRWVACGYSQIYGQDYHETYSPTVNFKSIVSLLHYGATMNYNISIVDIGNAYLETKLDKPIVMLIHPYFKQIMNWSVEYIDVLGGLYGLKQAGLLWYILLCDILSDFGLVKSDYDECCFRHPVDNLLVVIYVDDILILSDKQDLIDGLINHLTSRLVKVKYEKANEFTFLGVRITRDRHGRTINLSQPLYVESILGQELDPNLLPSRYPIKDSNLTMASPYETGSESLRDRVRIFTRIVGKLRYLADRTRPDLQYTLSRLASVMTRPSNEQTGSQND